MSSPSLPGLVSKLIVQIFKLLPNCRDVAALCRTSRKIYRVWVSEAAAISRTVLPRVIDCYDEAEALVRYQTALDQKWEAGKSDTDYPKTDDAYQKLLKRNQRFADNASMISRECTDMQAEAYSKLDLRPPETDRRRRENFLHLAQIRYRLHCVVALSHDQAAQDQYLEAMSLPDLEEVQDQTTWSNSQRPDNDYRYFSIYMKTRRARDPFKLIEKVYDYRMFGEE